MHIVRQTKKSINVAVAILLLIALVIEPLTASTVQASTAGVQPLEQREDPAPPTRPSARTAIDTTDIQAEKATKVNKEADTEGEVSAASTALDTYIVVLEDAPVASYQGGVAGLAPTNPAAQGRSKLDLQSPESQAYLRYLEQQQADVILRMDRTLNRQVEVVYTYKAALNGFAARLTPAEASRLRKLDGVKDVRRDQRFYAQTDAGPAWMGATAIWGGGFDALPFTAILSGTNEVPSVATAASGLGTFHYNFETNELTYEVSVANIISITAAHIHSGTVGVNGPVLFPLYMGDGVFDPANPVRGTVTLNDAQQALLMNGGLYVNVHTTANPSGEIRGQIVRTGTMGEGMVVGILDTGINMDHPSFADIGGDGYNHTNPRGRFYGWCDPQDPNYDPTLVCNDKLIGVWSGDADSPEDADGHGTHVGSTVAGNVIENPVINAPTTSISVPRISGVAPHANIIAYNIEAEPGSGSSFNSVTIAATEQAILDQVDVINYSFGSGPFDPWLDAENWYHVRQAGIFVATSASNDGPAPDTIGSPANAPWLMSVAASSHDRQFSNALTNLAGGATQPPPDILGEGVTGGYGPAPIVYAGAVDPNNVGCDVPYAPGTFQGEIVVCDYNDGPQYNGRVNKSINLAQAGAGGFILINHPAWKAALMVDSYAIPGLGIPFDQGEALKAWLATGSGHTGVIRGVQTEPAQGDIVAGFSSRGPNGPVPDIIKPDVTAPGRRIVAAVATTDPANPPEFDVYQGTSMSSPHAAGAATLIRALHPDWTPAEVQSALMSTAFNADIRKEDGMTPADPFDVGAGRIDLSLAMRAGLVLDETPENLWASNPDAGGDPKTLNLASMADDQCLQQCRWTRTVKSTLDRDETWTVTSTAAPGVTISAEPAQFTLAPGATQEIVITADVTAADRDAWLFGEVQLTPAGDTPPAHLPVAMVSTASIFPESVDIHTRRNAGSQVITGLMAIDIADLTVTTHGLVKGTESELFLSADPTNDDPYDNVNDGTVSVTTVEVPAGALRLAVDVPFASAPDVDLYVGTGSVPGLETEVCSSTSPTALESCLIDFPAAGTWWILVQNWQASDAPPDIVILSHAVVAGDNGNLTVEEQGAIPAGQSFGVRVFWNEPALQPFETWYGAISLGTDPANPGNLGTIFVNLVREADDVVKFSYTSAAEPGDTVTYEIVVEANVTPETLTYAIQDTIPAGLTYVPGSATVSTGTVEVNGNVLTWTGVMPPAHSVQGRYDITTNQTNAQCTTPFGGYIDVLTESGGAIMTQPGIFGDTIGWLYPASAGTDFYGAKRATSPLFTDDGIVVFGEYAGQPWFNQNIPDLAPPNGLFAPYWRDMEIVYDAATNKGVTVATLGGGDAWLVEFDDIQAYQDPTTTLDFEVLAWKDALPTVATNPLQYDVYYAFDNVNVADTIGTIGVENDAGNAGTQFAFDNFTPTNGLVICLDYVGAVPAVITYQATVDADAAEGVVTNEVIHNTDNPGSQPAIASAPLEIDRNEVLFLSLGSSARVSGLSVRDEDILAYNTLTGEWSKLFDGSDVGVGDNDINAFALTEEGELYVSFNDSEDDMDDEDGYEGPAEIEDTDIYHFIPTSLGDRTAGRFELFFDGSDVGLTKDGEDIDALFITPWGDLIISTLGSYKVPGPDGTELSGRDEDLLLFIPTSLGEETAGTWNLLMDGSVEGLGDPGEDVSSVWWNQAFGEIFMTSYGGFSVEGASGDSADILLCTLAGAPNLCSFGLALDGATLGLEGERIDGLSFGVLPPLVAPATTASEDAAELWPEPNDEANDDVADEEAQENSLYLPFVRN
jgi:uncharacterized repeat protein (TIGR01451 family)